MTIMRVCRLDGLVINIGDWDAQPLERQVLMGLECSEEPQEDGSYQVIWRDAVTRDVANVGDPEFGRELVPTNPVPLGAVWSDEEVVRGPDGGLFVAGDPRLP